ncbi:hypothetical protein B4U79_14250, partial [Dinothrombium tinctorium]
LTSSSFQEDCLQSHNYYRQLENKPPLQIRQDLVDFAQYRANSLSYYCSFNHDGNDGSGYGENLSGYKNCRDAVKQWYDEKINYTMPIFTMDTGHYTQ